MKPQPHASVEISLTTPKIYAKWSYVFQINPPAAKQKSLLVRPPRNRQNHMTYEREGLNQGMLILARWKVNTGKARQRLGADQNRTGSREIG